MIQYKKGTYLHKGGGEMEKTYILMHGDHTAAVLMVDPWDGWITDVLDILESSHLPPLAEKTSHQNDSRAKGRLLGALRVFWKERLIPAGRYKEYAYHGQTMAGAMALSGYGVNLSDGWWLKEENSSISWDTVNAFSHPFSSYFETPEPTASPDFCTNGNLPKYWAWEENHPVLYKLGNEENQAEAYHEVIASHFLDVLYLPHVPYRLKRRAIDGITYPWSVCPAFTSKEIEYIPAWYILGLASKRNEESEYAYFLRCAKEAGIPPIQKQLDAMLAFDYFINNTDRHYGNFGFLRRVDTLEWLGMAPIFDNGNSFWFDEPDAIRLKKQRCLPFWNDQEKMLSKLSYVFDVSALDDDLIAEEIRSGVSPCFSQEITDNLIYAVLEKRRRLQRAGDHRL